MAQKPSFFFYDHLAEFFKLGAPIQLEINNDLPESELSSLKIEMNGILLTNNLFIGKFFQNREFQLSDDNVSAWKIEVIEKNGAITQSTCVGAACRFTMPDCQAVKITSLNNTESIDAVVSGCEVRDIDFYDVNGIKHSHLQKGINIIRMKDGSVSKLLN